MAKKKTLDFTNVKEGSGFNPKHKAEGDYRAKITGVVDGKAKSGNDMWTFTVALVSDARAIYPERCTLTDNALWRVRNLFVAAGVKIPKKKMTLDPDRIIGREIGVTLEDDEYEGRLRSTIATVFPVSELTGDEPDSDEEDEEYEDEEEEDEEPEEEEEPAPKKKAKGKSKKKAPEPEPEEEDEEEEDEEEEDEEEEPEPPKKKPAKKKAAAAKKKPADDEEEDEDELDVDDL